MIIKDWNGNTERLTNYTIPSRKQGANGSTFTISTTITKNKKNHHSYGMVINENIIIDDDGNEYIIKNHNEITKGNTVQVSIEAVYRPYIQLLGNVVYERVNGALRLSEIVSFCLKGSGFTYTVNANGLPLSVEVQNFGFSNSLSLLRQTIEKFGAELDVIGEHVYIGQEIAEYTDEQFRYNYNIKSLSKTINTNGFSTRIKGFGKKKEDGSYVVETEYTSPLAQTYGIQDADPIEDERYTDHESMLERLKQELNDQFPISLKLSYSQLKRSGADPSKIKKGDYVWCIIKPFNIKTRVRVIEIEDFPDKRSKIKRNPIFSLSNIQEKMSNTVAHLSSGQRVAKKDINDTKVTVIQTQKTVNAAVEKIENNTVDLTDMKESLEGMDNVLGEYEKGILANSQNITTLNTKLDEWIKQPVLYPELKGKKGNFLGDSLTSAYGTTKSYWQYICEKYEMTGRNYGISGTCISGISNSSGESMVTRYSKMNTDADFNVVFGGTNDYWQNMPMGAFTDRTTDSFYGSLHLLVDGLITKYPTKGLLFVTPFCFSRSKNSIDFYVKDYVNAIKEVAEYYSVPVYDAYANSGLTTTNATLKPLIAIDSVHLNEKGHLILSKRLESFLLPLIL
ncbi:phage tail spike protein [Bacillus sp. FSL R10-2780]|uniref:phage tail spike protein n=1 Tax=Bacillus sp. FSL R10-2780 TaxID=2954660 RepID=UPI0030F6F30E